LGRNRVTDVLAFGQNQKSKIKNQKLEELGLGEIVTCLREVKKNAKRSGQSFEKELARVLIHGILHLLGYNHEKNEKEAEKMEEKEKYYLSLIKS
jgi:rRNA maturation RNase YbeY